MGGISGDRDPAPASGKPWSAARCKIRRRTFGVPSATVCEAGASTTRWGATHGEAEAHEGQVGRRDANRASAVPIDSHADQDPEDDQWRLPVGPRFSAGAPGGSPA
jgi:hypothetical protein